MNKTKIEQRVKIDKLVERVFFGVGEVCIAANEPTVFKVLQNGCQCAARFETRFFYDIISSKALAA